MTEVVETNSRYNELMEQAKEEFPYSNKFFLECLVAYYIKNGGDMNSNKDTNNDLHYETEKTEYMYGE
jgi:hypothetical protein